MDSTLSEALKEAYASAPVEEIIYHTLEFRHSAFSQPIRVVRDHANLTATLEPGAPVDGGETVEFVRYAFNLEQPEINERGLPELGITIDNVSREIVANIELAVVTSELIEVTYRAYLASDTSGPHNDPPMTLVIRQITADPFQVTARAAFEDLTRSAFPRRSYTLREWGGLAR